MNYWLFLRGSPLLDDMKKTNNKINLANTAPKKSLQSRWMLLMSKELAINPFIIKTSRNKLSKNSQQLTTTVLSLNKKQQAKKRETDLKKKSNLKRKKRSRNRLHRKKKKKVINSFRYLEKSLGITLIKN